MKRKDTEYHNPQEPRTRTARETNPANTLTLALSIQNYKKQISAIQTTQSVLSYFGDPSKLIEDLWAKEG